MRVSEEARYRMRLAEGFLDEARQDVELKRWRSCIDNSQLAAENAGKTALALLGPVGRTHNPAVLLRQALEDGRYPPEARSSIEQIAERAEMLGSDVHAEATTATRPVGRRRGNCSMKPTPATRCGQPKRP